VSSSAHMVSVFKFSLHVCKHAGHNCSRSSIYILAAGSGKVVGYGGPLKASFTCSQKKKWCKVR
jgi:hypothetical protein